MGPIYLSKNFILNKYNNDLECFTKHGIRRIRDREIAPEFTNYIPQNKI